MLESCSGEEKVTEADLLSAGRAGGDMTWLIHTAALNHCGIVCFCCTLNAEVRGETVLCGKAFVVPARCRARSVNSRRKVRLGLMGDITA